MIFLGLLYDTVAMTISVPEDKLEEIKSLIRTWLFCCFRIAILLVNYCTYVLAFVLGVCLCKDFPMSYTHIIQLRGFFQIPAELFDDLKWWSDFLNVYNGVSLIPEPVWVSDPSDFLLTHVTQVVADFTMVFTFT